MKMLCIDYKDIFINIMIDKIDFIEYNYKDKAVVISINRYLRAFYGIDKIKYEVFSKELEVFLENESVDFMRFDFNNKQNKELQNEN